MTFEQWLQSRGFDHAALGEGQLRTLRVAYDAEQRAAQPAAAAVPVAQPVAQPVQQAQPAAAQPAAPAPAPTQTIDDIFAANRRETERQDRIAELTAQALERDPRNEDLEPLARRAIEERWPLQQFELGLLRAERPRGPHLSGVAGGAAERPAEARVVEAALCMAGRLGNIERHYDERTLEAAHRQFRGGLGLQQLVLLSARRNGYRNLSVRGDLAGALRAAFQGGDGLDLRSGGPSAYSLPGILANTANKFLREAFLAVETSWREVCTIRPVVDFKAVSSYSLTGDNTYEKVSPGGEIRSGQLGERSYSNQADTYGKLLGIDRRDIINDDLGAFTGASRRLGRGGALKLNDVFWTEWLDDSTFFPTDKSYNNYDDGATDSVLSLAGLENADLIFRQQTDPDGKPLGVAPAILLVPVTLRATALNLMNSTLTASAQSTATLGLANVWQGMFRVVASTYLSNSSYTGYSATAWYLLANPADLSAIEACFLNGQEMPTIETADMDFDRLGIAMRGYFDFGVSKQEYRAAVKLKGAA